VAGGGAPLYGRALLRRRLRELEPWCTPWFAPRYQPEQLVEAYSYLGGVPFYLRLLDDSRPPLEELLRILGPGGVLEDEPLFLLRDEFREPHPYLALLRAIAVEGAATLGEAAQHAGLPTSHASKYLHVLADLGLVEREPILFQQRRRRYRVADNAVAAWLAVVEPAAPLLRDNPAAGLEKARRLAVAHVSRVWERLACRHAVAHLAPSLGARPTVHGRLERRGEEVDCVAIDEDEKIVVAVEAKWSSLDTAEAENLARTVNTKLDRLLPGSHRGYQRRIALYLRSLRGPPPRGAEAVTAEQLPWRSGCPSPAAGKP